MKLRGRVSDILKPLAVAHRVIGNTTISPLLSNVAIEAQSKTQRLAFAATDLELFFAGSAPAAVSEPGRILISGAVLENVLRAFRADAEVDIESTADFQLKVRSGRSSYNLFGLAADDFPEFPEFPAVGDGGALVLPGDRLRQMVKEVDYAISDDDSKPNLIGIHFKIAETTLTAVATDGRRLALSAWTRDSGFGAPTHFTIPRKILSEFARAADVGDVDLQWSKNQVRLSWAGSRYVSRLIEGAFPYFDAGIPKTEVTALEVPTELLISELRGPLLLARDNAHTVRVALKPDQLEITAHSAKAGSAVCSIPLEIKGVSLKIAFNGLFLSEALAAIKSETACLSFSGPGTATKITPKTSPADETHIHVLMPMRSL